MSTWHIHDLDMLYTFVLFEYRETKIIPVLNISMHFRVSRIWDAISIKIELNFKVTFMTRYLD